MDKIVKFLFIGMLSFCLAACGSDDEPDAPDINLVDSSLDATFAKLNGQYTSTWAESFNDVRYDFAFSPYSSPKDHTIRVSDGGNVNFTKKVRIFGRVNVVKTYIFSNGTTSENSNKEYLYGIESTVGEPYQLFCFPYSTSGSEDIIYGLSTSFYIKNISANSFNLSVYGKDGDYHQFTK